MEISLEKLQKAIPSQPKDVAVAALSEKLGKWKENWYWKLEEKKTMLLVRCSQLYNPNISSFFDKSQAHGTCHWWALLSFHSLLYWLYANKMSDDVHLYWVVQLQSLLPQPSHKKRARYAKGLTLFFRFIGGRRVPSLKAKICSLPWKENNPPFLSQFSADFWLSSLYHLEAILQCEQGNSQ